MIFFITNWSSNRDDGLMFSMQEDNINEYTDVKCYMFTF